MVKPDFASMKAQQLIDFSEDATALHRWERSNLYKAAREKFQDAGDEQRAEEMRKEVLVFDLATPPNSERRFASAMSRTTDAGAQVRYPDWDTDFPPDSLDYYKRRAGETANPVLKARYADVIWERLHEHTYGRLAARAYLECHAIFYAEEMHPELVDALDRSLALAMRINDKALTREVVATHHAFIRQLTQDKRYRVLLELGESLLSRARRLKGVALDLPLLADALEEALRHYADNEADSFIIQRGFLAQLVALRQLQGDEAAARATRARVAESFVAEAEWKRTNYGQGNMVAASFYEDALKAYLDLGGFPEKVEELKVKIQEANEAGAKTELRAVSAQVEIPVEPLEEHLDRFYRGRAAGQVFALMGQDPNLSSSYGDARRVAAETVKKYLLQNLLGTAVMKGNIVVKHITADEERLEYRAIQYFQQSYRIMASVFLDQIFAILEAEHPDYLDELERYLAASDIISAGRIEIIRHGLRAFGQREYVAANHILVFQIEGILRDMLAKAGLPTFTFRDNQMRERLLSDILATLGQFGGIDQDFLRFIDIYLNNILGDNYRNDIAHALLPADAFTRQHAELLLLILIKLAPYRATKQEANSGG